ncbi:MAG TPA: hypothetical protein VI195_09790 [Steroidobacteraceae bacterium]
MDQDSVKLGLLIEAAQAHQKLAEAAVEKLRERTQALEPVVRDQVQRALADELNSLRTESIRVIEALQTAKRGQCAHRLLDAWCHGDHHGDRALRCVVGAPDAG